MEASALEQHRKELYGIYCAKGYSAKLAEALCSLYGQIRTERIGTISADFTISNPEIFARSNLSTLSALSELGSEGILEDIFSRLAS